MHKVSKGLVNVNRVSAHKKTPAEQRRAQFARDAVFAEFRARDAKAIDYEKFTDR